MASSIGGGMNWTLDASPEILLESERYAGPWGGIDGEEHHDEDSLLASGTVHAMTSMPPSFSFGTSPHDRHEETPTPSYGRRPKTRRRTRDDDELGDDEEATSARPLLGDYESDESDGE